MAPDGAFFDVDNLLTENVGPLHVQDPALESQYSAAIIPKAIKKTYSSNSQYSAGIFSPHIGSRQITSQQPIEDRGYRFMSDHAGDGWWNQGLSVYKNDIRAHSGSHRLEFTLKPIPNSSYPELAFFIDDHVVSPGADFEIKPDRAPNGYFIFDATIDPNKSMLGINELITMPDVIVAERNYSKKWTVSYIGKKGTNFEGCRLTLYVGMTNYRGCRHKTVQAIKFEGIVKKTGVRFQEAYQMAHATVVGSGNGMINFMWNELHGSIEKINDDQLRISPQNLFWSCIDPIDRDKYIVERDDVLCEFTRENDKYVARPSQRYKTLFNVSDNCWDYESGNDLIRFNLIDVYDSRKPRFEAVRIITDKDGKETSEKLNIEARYLACRNLYIIEVSNKSKKHKIFDIFGLIVVDSKKAITIHLEDDDLEKINELVMGEITVDRYLSVLDHTDIYDVFTITEGSLHVDSGIKMDFHLLDASVTEPNLRFRNAVWESNSDEIRDVAVDFETGIVEIVDADGSAYFLVPAWSEDEKGRESDYQLHSTIPQEVIGRTDRFTHLPKLISSAEIDSSSNHMMMILDIADEEYVKNEELELFGVTVEYSGDTAKFIILPTAHWNGSEGIRNIAMSADGSMIRINSKHYLYLVDHIKGGIRIAESAYPPIKIFQWVGIENEAKAKHLFANAQTNAITGVERSSILSAELLALLPEDADRSFVWRLELMRMGVLDFTQHVNFMSLISPSSSITELKSTASRLEYLIRNVGISTISKLNAKNLQSILALSEDDIRLYGRFYSAGITDFESIRQLAATFISTEIDSAVEFAKQYGSDYRADVLRMAQNFGDWKHYGWILELAIKSTDLFEALHSLKLSMAEREQYLPVFQNFGQLSEIDAQDFVTEAKLYMSNATSIDRQNFLLFIELLADAAK